MGECLASVRVALPPGAEHVVKKMERSYAEERFAALRSSEFCGFVDDDDVVYPDSIKVCAEALEKSGAGIAFTYQEVIDEAGCRVRSYGVASRYLDVAMSPQGIHHFALLRRDAVGDEVFSAATEVGVGVDWLMKANAALRHGAILVPQVGYGWRQHPSQDHRDKDATFKAALPKLRDVTMSWVRSNERIPHYH